MAADLADQTDFENARRGLVARLEPGVITGAAGNVVFNADAYEAASAGECPDTANPSLWRQSQLTAIQGLFEVIPGFYQLRGIELSNMTVIEGDTGVIIIDPAVSSEVAAAGLALYRQHRGDREVRAVIYTHSHVDHFGGVLGVIGPDSDVPIYAPEGFLEHAVSENVYAGVAMMRRSIYHTGANLAPSPTGTLGAGLGSGTSKGTIGLLAPTESITHTGEERTIDGVRVVFQLTPETEAPAEMNFYFPDHKALCSAENATHTLHNLLTLRGAEVRDARAWSRYLAELIELFGHEAEVVFASHHWPTWGNENVLAFLTCQRDLYCYLHDQTLRMLNNGYVGSEIAEMIEMPPGLDAQWNTHGYYGSVSHNVKAIYQRYLGWYDGNPAHLWQHTPADLATRYVDLAGGIDAAVAKVKEYADAGDLRFAAELGSHCVFAAPDNADAREVLFAVLTQLGHGSENATWRNNYLTGARELVTGIEATQWSPGGMAAALTITQLFDSIGITIDGPKAWDTRLSIRWHFTDSGESYWMELSHGALIHYPTERIDPADLVVTLTKPQFLALLTGSHDGVGFEGDPTVLQTLIALTAQPDASFPIVTP